MRMIGIPLENEKREERDEGENKKERKKREGMGGETIMERERS